MAQCLPSWISNEVRFTHDDVLEGDCDVPDLRVAMLAGLVASISTTRLERESAVAGANFVD